MTLLQAFAIAVVQGATELFPVSSLGHAVLLPWLLGWSVDQHALSFLPFLVMLHLGTAVALFAFFWRTWWTLVCGVIGRRSHIETRRSRRLLLLVVIATLPAVLVGGLLEHELRRIFARPLFASAFLIANAAVLFFGDRLGPKIGDTEREELLARMSGWDAFAIGWWQCLALLPGLSRSGATMVGGLLRGLNHEASAHFSFLIALPVILAATAKEVPSVLASRSNVEVLEIAGASSVVAGLVAFASTAFLMRYFRVHERQALRPFALYCLLAGGGTLAYGAF